LPTGRRRLLGGFVFYSHFWLFSVLFQVSSEVLFRVIVLMENPVFLIDRGFPIVGPFVLMILKMVKRDLTRFFLIDFVFLMGFSQGNSAF
jgi:hypothetical protein